MTILKKNSTDINLITDPVDVDEIFNNIMKGHPNGFLH